MVEVWKDITGYEGMYEVSSFGRIKSLKWNKERILKPMKDVNGYLFVNFRKDGKLKMFKIHRLVLQTFNPIDNMDELQVDHKNRNKEDNRLCNLRWCTRKEQQYFEDQDWCTHAKKVYQYTKSSGEFIREWESTISIERELGYDGGNICRCCNGKRKSAYKFIWTYEKKDCSVA